jgi:hypothetical protein
MPAGPSPSPSPSPSSSPQLGHSNDLAWPALPLGAWRETYDTLHMWAQIVGKVCLAMTPRTNHWWNVAFRPTSRGLATPMMSAGDRALTMTFDLMGHRLVLQLSDGTTETIALEPQTVADFYRSVMSTLARLGVNVRIWPMPVEVPHPIRFESDVMHHEYDAAAATTFCHQLVAMTPIFEQFRGRFIGKCSPVHFFWGSFDLACTRFSGRRAPERPGADSITREAYSHEVISHGFWPGSTELPEPAFYAYAAPEPEGFKDAKITPSAAYYHAGLSIFILPYETVRTSASPAAMLTEFFESTYDAGATLARWDRANLERDQG